MKNDQQLSLFDLFTTADENEVIVVSSGDNEPKDITEKTDVKKVKKTVSKSSVGENQPNKKMEIKKVGLGGEFDWKIRYAGTTYYLNLLFEEEINDGVTEVTLEQIREKLVISEFCIELSPQRAYWNSSKTDIDQQLLILICKGQDKAGV